jgi:hypothetical protein
MRHDPKLGWDATSQEISIVEPEKLSLARELLTFLVRTLKTMFLYPQNNPIPSEFRNSLFEKFTRFLDEYEELKLVADQGKLLLQGEVVHEDTGHEEGIALAMYRDGIREMVFKEGLSAEELRNFLEAIKCSLQGETAEDDLVTLLWERDFLHIRYTVIEQASDLPEPILLESATVEDFEKIYYSEVSLTDQSPLSTERLGLEVSELVSAEIANLLKNMGSFQKEELAEINSLLQVERFYRRQAEVITLLFEIIYQEEQLAGFSETLGLVQKVSDQFLAGRRFDLAVELLRQLKKAQEYYLGRSDSRAEKLRLAVERLGEKEQFSKLTEMLNHEKQLPAEQVYQYLVLLSPLVIPSLIQMLGELKTFASRKLLCQVLEFYAHNQLEQVAKGILDKRWYVVRNLAMVLGRTKDPRILSHLKRTLKHSDFRVRKESILALSRLNTREANLLLIESLSDPDRKIRLSATRVLAAAREKVAFLPLWKQITAKDFIERGEDEIKETFQALVLVDQEESLKYILEYLRKFHLWQRGRHLECKLLALEALEKSSSPNLSSCFEKITSLRNRAVSNTARRILQLLEARSRRKEELDAQPA